jgi:FkbM family methyltransferase
MSIAEFVYKEVLRPSPLKALANSILLRLIPESLRIGPALIHLDPEDPVVSGALSLGVFEQAELAFFRERCREGMTLVDIGANVGLYTALAIHSLGPQGRIVAIEPVPETFSFLRRTVDANLAERPAGAPRVDLFQVAAASRKGTFELILNPNNHGDNRLYGDAGDGETWDWRRIAVKGLPIDDLLEAQGIRKVDFVKIDIQGYEGQALSGFRKTLERSEDVILLSEFWPKGLREAGGEPLDYLEELAALGFRLNELKGRHPPIPLKNPRLLIDRLGSNRYTNLIGFKGDAA